MSASSSAERETKLQELEATLPKAILNHSFRSSDAQLLPHNNFHLPTTLTDRIPGEIHDYILDHLHSDPSSLAVCSLVCRTWLHASRHHLFPTVEVRRQNVRVFRALLRSPHSTFGPSVRRLLLRAGKVVRPDDFIGSTLPAVKSLLLSATFSVPVEKLFAWTRPCVPRLVELVLYSISLDSLAEFAEGLHELEALQHLALAHVNWVDPSCFPSSEGKAERASAPLPSLRSLVLKGYNTNLAWWLVTNNVLSIARLCLRRYSRKSDTGEVPSPFQDIGQIYRAFGASLQELDLYEDYHVTIDLSTNLDLRALWFHDVVLSLGQWVIDVLQKVVSPHLHTIALHVFSDDHGQRALIGAFNWHALGSLIAKAPFNTNLKSLRISLFGYYEDAELTTDLYKKCAEHIPGSVQCIVLNIEESEKRFGVTTHERVFDRHIIIE